MVTWTSPIQLKTRPVYFPELMSLLRGGGFQLTKKTAEAVESSGRVGLMPDAESGAGLGTDGIQLQVSLNLHQLAIFQVLYGEGETGNAICIRALRQQTFHVAVWIGQGDLDNDVFQRFENRASGR